MRERKGRDESGERGAGRGRDTARLGAGGRTRGKARGCEHVATKRAHRRMSALVLDAARIERRRIVRKRQRVREKVGEQAMRERKGK